MVLVLRWTDTNMREREFGRIEREPELRNFFCLLTWAEKTLMNVV